MEIILGLLGLSIGIAVYVLTEANVKMASWLLWVLGAIAACLMIFALSLIVRRFLIWAKSKHLRFQITLRSPISDTNETVKVSTISAPSDWPTALADKDKVVARLHICKEVTWQWSGIDKNNPSVDARIEVVNASIFDMYVNGIKGGMRILGEPSEKDAIISPCKLSHGQKEYIRIHQIISDRTARKLTEARETKTEVDFDFYACDLQFEIQEHGKARIALTKNLEWGRKLIPDSRMQPIP